MRTVLRSLLTAGATLIGVASAAAQVSGPRPAARMFERIAGPARTPAAVLERLVSFDVDADDRISRDELPERMEGLIARGDRNADAVLDSNEIRALVSAAASRPVSSRPQPSEGLPGVIRDLKLPPAKHQRALVIVGAQIPPRHVNDPASSALLGEMKALLDDDEYENLLAAAKRLSRKLADISLRSFN